MAAPARPSLRTHLAAVWPIGELSGWPGASGFGARSTASEVLAAVDLRGRVFVVTGGTAGLGAATAGALACAGARVVVACRDAAKGGAVAAQLSDLALHAGGSVEAMHCDLASLASVRAFAQAFVDAGLPLHGLVCNAGVMPVPFSLTADSHETHWQTNYLAHALLAELLLPTLERTADTSPVGEARIVFVTSLVHHFGYRGGIRWDKVDAEDGYVPWKAYSQSKLACLLHARAMDIALAARGSRVVAHAAHPGAVPTRGAAAAEAHSGAAGGCLSALGKHFVRSVEQGAASIVFAAASPQLARHRVAFVCNANVSDGHASKLARDGLAAFKLADLARAQLGNVLLLPVSPTADEASVPPTADEVAMPPSDVLTGPPSAREDEVPASDA